jgi:hypothetical protein
MAECDKGATDFGRYNMLPQQQVLLRPCLRRRNPNTAFVLFALPTELVWEEGDTRIRQWLGTESAKLVWAICTVTAHCRLRA